MTRIYAFDGREVREIGAPPRTLRSAAWSPDARSALLVGNRGAALRFVPPKSFEELDTRSTHNLRGVAWAPGGTQALIAGNRGAVLLYDGGRFHSLPAATQENLRRVAWAPDGSCALVVGNGGCVLRFDTASGRLVQLPGDRAHTMRAVAWRPDGAYALIGGYATRHAGYPRPYVLYRCDGRFVQGILATDDEDDAVAIDWRPGANPPVASALLTRYAGEDNPLPSKIVQYDGSGFGYRSIEPRSGFVTLLGLGWHPSGEYALLCGERGRLLVTDGSTVRGVRSGTGDTLVGPFWQPAESSPVALLLEGPETRTYTV